MKNIIGKLRQPKQLQKIILASVAALVILSVIFIFHTANRVQIDDSLVTGPVTTVSPLTSGKLQEIDVYEGENIKKGDIIGVINGQNYASDVDGIVLMANNQIGSLVGPQNPLAQIIDSSQMRIAGTIDENKGLKDVKVGQVVSFTIDALPGQTFWGYVDEISPSAKSTQVAFSISSERPTQQFVVYAKFDRNLYPAIKNGMSAKMTVYTNIK